MIVWRLRENCPVSCVQYCAVHTHLNRPNSCLLVKFSFSVVVLCVTVYLCYI